MPALARALVGQIFFLILRHHLSHLERSVLEVDLIDFDRVEVETVDEDRELLDADSFLRTALILALSKLLVNFPS